MLNREIIVNIAFLIASTYMYSINLRFFQKSPVKQNIFTGILFGSISILSMIFSFKMNSGLIFDGRSIILSLSGVFGGYISATISIIIALIYRINLGGEGLFTGSSVIIATGIIGSLFHHISKKKKNNLNPFHIYFFGLFVHLVTILLFLTIPGENAYIAIKNLWKTFIFIFPVITVIIYFIFNDQKKRLLENIALQESEKKYAELYNNSPDMYVSVDAETAKILRCNNTLVRTTGYTKDEIIGTSIFDMYHPECMEKVKKAFHTFQSTGEVKNAELIIKTKDESKIDVTLHVSSVRDANGEILYSNSIWRDISQRKSLENKLKWSEKLFSNTFKFSPVATAITKLPERLIFDLNPACEKLFGYLKDEMAGKPASEFKIWESPEEQQKVFKQFIQNGIVEDYEFSFKTKSGNIGKALFYSVNIEFQGDKYILLNFIDITERKNVEEELNYNKTFIESIVNSSPDIIYIYDIEDQKNIYVNEGIQKNLGFTNEEIKKMGDQVLPELMHPDDFQFYLKNTVPKYFTAKDNEQIVTEYRMKDNLGNWHWLYCKEHIFLRKTDGTPKQIFGVTVDITDRKLTEEKLSESEAKLELFFSQSLDGFFFMMLDEPIIWNEKIDVEKTLDYVFAHQRITKINDAMLNQYLAKREDFIGMTPNEMFSHDIEYGKRVWKQFFDEGQLHIETDERRTDGSQMWVEGDYICIYNSEGHITGHFGIQRDITERKKAEEKLHEAEERYRASFEYSRDGIIIFTSDRKILSSNNEFRNLCGYGENELKSMTLSDIFPKANVEMSKNRISNLLLGKLIVPFEEQLLTIKQDFIPVEINVTLLKNSYGHEMVYQGNIRNITDRKQAEQALQLSEERLRLSTELANVAVWEFDFRTNSMSRSNNHDSLYGLKNQKEWKFETFLNATHPDDREYSNNMIQRSVAIGGPDKYTFDFRVVFPDQSIHWLMVTGQVIERNKKGEGIVVRGILIDITDRKETESALAESTLRYKLHFDHMLDAMAYHQLIYEKGKVVDYSYVNVNEAFYAQTGLKDVIGRKVSELVPGIHEGNPELIKRFERVAKTGTPEQYETFIQSSKTWYFTTLYSLSKDVIVSMFKNITESKLSEIQLKESEFRFRSLFEQATVGVAIIETKTGKFKSVNKKQCEIIGYSQEEILDSDFMTLTDPEDLEEDLLNMERLKNGEIESFMIEKRYIHKNGNIVWVNLNVAKLWLKSEDPKFHVAICEDITERKKAENEIRKLNIELEKRVEERTQDLEEKIKEVERMNKLFVGRELRMAELKQKIKNLEMKKE